MKYLLIALLAIGFLAGCVDYKEEVWFKADGSGTMTMKIIKPNDANSQPTTKEGIETEFKAIEGITLKSAKVETKDAEQFIEIECAFKDLATFMKLSGTQLGQIGIIGTVSLDVQADGTSKYLRTVTVATGNEKYNWEYITHLPGKVTETTQTDKSMVKGDTVTWKYNVVKNMGEQKMEATVAKAGGLNPIILIVIGVIVLGGIAAAVIFMKKKQTAAPQA